MSARDIAFYEAGHSAGNAEGYLDAVKRLMEISIEVRSWDLRDIALRLMRERRECRPMHSEDIGLTAEGKLP